LIDRSIDRLIDQFIYLFIYLFIYRNVVLYFPDFRYVGPPLIKKWHPGRR